MSDSGPTLRVTIRCLVDDLGIDGANARREVRELDHAICRAFETKRSQSPIGVEKLQPIATDAEVYTLHAGRWRGATWYDEENNAVWLLGCGYHRSGEKDDVYPYLKELDFKGDLFPASEDYELLFEFQDTSFAEALIADVPILMDEARAHPGTEVTQLIAQRIRISVVVEMADDLEAWWAAVSMQLLPGESEMPAAWLSLVLAAFFPDVSNPLELLTGEKLPTRSARPDELVFVHYRD